MKYLCESIDAINGRATGLWQTGNIAYNVVRCMIGTTTKEILIKTKIPFSSGRHMPVIHIVGYAYGLQSPIEIKIGYYIYNNTHGWCGAVSMGAWRPVIKLFSYVENSVKYTGIALIGGIYFPQFSVNVQIELGTTATDKNGWEIEYLDNSSSTSTIVPTTDVVVVPYKPTFSATINGVAFNGVDGIALTPSNIGAAPTSHNHTKAQITDFPSSMPASDVPAWAKASTKPSYAWSEIGSKPTTFTPASHTHDDRYYTESEVDAKITGASGNTVTVSTTAPTSPRKGDIWI